MIFGRVNASARKIVSGCSRLISASTHSQNRNGLVCGLSTRKILTPCSIQNSMTRFSSCQSACQSSRLEVERVDVLILLRRVLRVLDRAVGAMPEPLGMLAHVRDDRATPGRRCRARSRGRAAGRRRRSDRSPRACRGPVRPPCGRPRPPPIAHGLPGSSGAGVSVLLRPLRKLRPIGWIGGRYRTSKPIAATYGQPGRRFVERRAARRIGAGRAREHLVPRAESRALALDEHARARGRSAWPGCDRHARPCAARAPATAPTASRALCSRRDGPRARAASASAASSRRGARARSAPRRTSAAPSSSSLDDVLAGADLLRQLWRQRREAIDPAFDRVFVAQPSASTVKRAVPAIVAQRLHRPLRSTARSPRAADQQRGGERCRGRRRRCPRSTVTVSPDVRLIGNRPPSTCGADALDDDAALQRGIERARLDAGRPAVGELWKGSSPSFSPSSQALRRNHEARPHHRERPVGTPIGSVAAHRRAGCRASARPSIGQAARSARRRETGVGAATDRPCRAAFPIARSATSWAARTGSVPHRR